MSFKLTVASLLLTIVASQVAVAEVPTDEEKFFPADEGGIENQYIVLLYRGGASGGPSVEARGDDLTRRFGGEILRIWKVALEGFVGEMSEAQARAMAKAPAVQAVIQDRLIPWYEVLSNDTPYCYDLTEPLCTPGNWVLNERSFGGLPQAIQCSDPDPQASGCIDNWGLDRLDKISAQRDGEFDAGAMGTDVHVYVIDTGVKASHSDFGGRVTGGRNTTYDEPDCSSSTLDYPPCGSDTNDYLGHGTHVAGILGGEFAGVAKDVWIHPLRVFDRSCSLVKSAIPEALEWITKNHPASWGTAVVSMSMNNPDWGHDPVFEDFRVAARGLASRDDILFVQSAGNGSTDACGWGFGDEDVFDEGTAEYEATAQILIVGGSDETDARWVCDELGGDENCHLNPGSNTGRCIDIFAPAAHIVSAYHGDGETDGGKAVCRLAGTSMAAPQVSGVAALILESEPFLGTDDLRARILSSSLSGALESNSSDPNYIGADSPNLLLQFGSSVIFHDGFESKDSSAWSAKVP